MSKIKLEYVSKCKYINNYDLTYAKENDVGFDLRADIKKRVYITGNVICVPTGIYVDIPEGYEIQMRSRSGLATKGIFLVNSPGTIDPGYTGEIMAIITGLRINSQIDSCIEPNDKICQAVLKKVDYANFKKVEIINKITERGETGFGSSDKEK